MIDPSHASRAAPQQNRSRITMASTHLCWEQTQSPVPPPGTGSSFVTSTPLHRTCVLGSAFGPNMSFHLSKRANIPARWWHIGFQQTHSMSPTGKSANWKSSPAHLCVTMMTGRRNTRVVIDQTTQCASTKSSSHHCDTDTRGNPIPSHPLGILTLGPSPPPSSVPPSLPTLNILIAARLCLPCLRTGLHVKFQACLNLQILCTPS